MHVKLAYVASMVLLVLAVSSLPQVYAASYSSTWFIYQTSDQQKRHFANILVKYSSPDNAKGSLDVDVSLEYIKDASAQIAWMDIYNVAVYLRKTPKSTPSASSTVDSSKTRVKAGEHYTRKFSVEVPREQGSYFVTLAWKTYAPETSAYGFTIREGEMDWDTGDSSDQSTIPKTTTVPIPILTVKLQDVSSTSVRFDGQSVSIVDGTARINLSPGDHSLEVPTQVDLGTGKRAIFQEWSDASKANPRQVNSDKDITLVAIYKIQYLLTLETSKGNPQGAGWYDAGSQASFSVASPTGFPITEVLDRWEGDFSGSSPSGSILMAGPKTIKAVWRTDYTNLMIIGALIGVVVVVALVVVGRRGKAQPKIQEVPLPPRPEPYRERPVAPVETPRITRPVAPPPPAPVATAFKHCIHCGAKIPDVVTFCTKCGKKQE